MVATSQAYTVPMQLKHLKVFCDVATTRSFSRAAALNGISQSAVTQVVQQLEKKLGAQLIDRSKRPFVVSRAGQICLQGYREALDRCAAVQQSVHSQVQEIRGRVRVAAIYSVGLYAMNRCMQDFIRRHPKVKVRLEFLPPARVYEAARKQEVDLGVVSYPRPSRSLSVVPLRAEGMVLVCSPGHRLARIRKVTVDQLRGEAFVAFEPGLIIRREIDQYLRRRRAMVDVVMEFDNIETIKQAVEIGAGISILPEPTVHSEVERGTLAIAPLSLGDLRRPLGIIHRARKAFSPSVASFVELLRASQEEK
jgi:DNA-binding transcriptional LysR family regulator